VAKIVRIQITETQFPESHFYGDLYDGNVSVRFWSRDVACGAAVQTDGLPTQPTTIESSVKVYTPGVSGENVCFCK
jgi:hypothetical protein